MDFDSNLYDDLEPVEINKIVIEKISTKKPEILRETDDLEKSEESKNDEVDEEEQELRDVTDIQQRKIFVGGLKWTTTSTSLSRHFSKFGKVLGCDVVMDPMTMKSRGFGFVTFSTRSAVDLVLRQEHFIDGKMVDPKRSVPIDKPDIIAKLFIGGLPQDATSETLTTHFSKWGKILNASITTDPSTGRSRGFGFVTFDDIEDLEDCLDDQARKKIVINSKPVRNNLTQVDVRKAVGRSRQNVGGDGTQYKNRSPTGSIDDEVDSERSYSRKNDRSYSRDRDRREGSREKSVSRDRRDDRDRSYSRDRDYSRDRFQDRLGSRTRQHGYRNRSRSPRRQER